MNRDEKWQAESRLLEDGGCFISCAVEQLEGYGERSFLTELFFRHQASVYGSLLEGKQVGDRYGAVLSAYEAMTYWAEPTLMSIGRGVEWDGGFDGRVREARLLREALSAGWFAPGIVTDGATGRQIARWRLLRKGDGHPDPGFADRCGAVGWERLDAQLNFVLRSLTELNLEVSQAWDELAAASPLTKSLAAAMEPDEGLEEEEFWERIGFRTDRDPFAVGLRLTEPDSDGGVWRLQPILTGREDRSAQFAYEWSGALAPGQITPASWRKDAVAAAIRRKAELWLSRNEWLAWEMDDDRAWEFLESGSGKLTKQGIRVYLPQWWETLRHQRPAVVSRLRDNAGASGLFGSEQLLAFDWQLSLGGADVGVEDFRRAMNDGRRFLRQGDRWVPLHPRWSRALMRAIRRMASRETLTLTEALELLFSGGRELTDRAETAREGAVADSDSEAEAPIRWEVRMNDHVRRFVRQLEERPTGMYAPSAQLRATLRPYQRIGTEWLLFMRGCGFGACLADDMGLGKTLQLIAYLLELKERGQPEAPALIVCPTSVLGNWQKELAKFAPDLTVHLHYGAKSARHSGFAEVTAACDVVLTSYALVHLDADLLQERRWSVVALDEAQNIKNAQSKASKAVRELPAAHRLALTGTPIENRLGELWTLFDFLHPGYLGNRQSFQRRFGVLDTMSAEAAGPVREERLGQLQRLIRPFLLRRLKNDPAIQLDLPEKNENLIYVPLTVEQGTLYETELERMLEQLKQLEAMARRGAILATLGKLKQICDHPALYLKETASRPEPGRSHKLQRLLEMADEVMTEGRQAIIFTQFVEMGKLLQEELVRTFNCRTDFLHGGTSKAERDRMIARFQERGEDGGGVNGGKGKGGNGKGSTAAARDFSFLVLSLKAGGSGLNLTAATHVFHYDRWWNPAVEEQATDRAYRIGQTRDVQVHKFVALGTLEERIDEMIDRKKALSRQVIGSGESWITELTTDELKEMFALRREWVRD